MFFVQFNAQSSLKIQILNGRKELHIQAHVPIQTLATQIDYQLESLKNKESSETAHQLLSIFWRIAQLY